MPKVYLLKTKTNTYSVSEQKIKIDMGLQINLDQNDKKNRNIEKKTYIQIIQEREKGNGSHK